MSAWRRIALERFPERRELIADAHSIYDFLAHLEQDLRAIYHGVRDEPGLPDRVFAYAAWCFDPRHNAKLRNAAAVGFYEHLPDEPAGRRDIAEKLSFAQLAELNSLFFHMLTPQDYHALMEEVTRVHGQALPPLVSAT